MNGTVEELPSGRFRARKKNAAGRYKSLPGTFATRDLALAALGEPLPKIGMAETLNEFGELYLERRAKSGIRDIRTDRNRWKVAVTKDPIGDIAIKKLKVSDVRDFRDRLISSGLKSTTVSNVLNLLRVCLEDAVERETITRNPAREVRLNRSSQAVTEDTWTVLDPDEQLIVLRTVLQHCPDEWHAVAFALSSGVRPGEQWALRWQDVDLPGRVVVIRQSARWGKIRPTKTGKGRRVPLTTLAVQAIEEALLRRKKGCVWVFPTPRTNTLRATDHPRRWQKWLALSGITRRVRWYDLRHTCATALLAGWWDRRWSLDEVRQMLGHSTVKITERYAHLLDETLLRAGHATGFHADPASLAPGGKKSNDNAGADFEIRTRDLRFTKTQVGKWLRQLEGLTFEEFHARSTAVDLEVVDGWGAAVAVAQDQSRPGVLRKAARARLDQFLATEARRLGGAS